MAIFKALKSIAGPVFGAAMDAYGQNKANKANAKENRLNREFQERMSSTAYQRSADDLEAAGLNRILALGSPASSPGGNVASYQNVMGGAGEMINKADLTASAARLSKADRALRENQNKYTSQQTALAKQQEELARNNSATAAEQARSARIDAQVKEDIYNNYGHLGGAAMQILGSGAGSIIGAGAGAASAYAIGNRNKKNRTGDSKRTSGTSKQNPRVVTGSQEVDKPTGFRNIPKTVLRKNPHPLGSYKWKKWLEDNGFVKGKEG